MNKVVWRSVSSGKEEVYLFFIVIVIVIIRLWLLFLGNSVSFNKDEAIVEGPNFERVTYEIIDSDYTCWEGELKPFL